MENLKKAVDELCEVAKELKEPKWITMSKFLRQRIYQPDSYLVFLGESCSGKSTLINKLIGKDILPVSSIPSTGAITEVFFDRETTEEDYFAINQNATMEQLNKDTFCELALRPDENLERLRLTMPTVSDHMAGIRIFDTPGYGSLVEQHDEVLMNFLPNCDLVVYTVSYRMGIQEDDYQFLKRLMELVRDGVPVYLLVNRCPKGVTKEDRRIKEIYQYVTSLLEKDTLPMYLIETFNGEDKEQEWESLHAFWEQASKEIHSKERQEELKESYKSYLKDLSASLRMESKLRIGNMELSEESLKKYRKSKEELIDRFRHAETEIIRPGFDRIRNQFANQVSSSRKRINKEVCCKIDAESAFHKDETAIFINEHLIKMEARNEVDELQFYMVNELNALDHELNDYLNTAVIKFEADLKIQNVSATEEAVTQAMKDFAGEIVNNGLMQYFAQFGGAGGASAGIANAASHTLKVVGDFFGHTFSRETHNALKSFLAKMGMTSTSVLCVASSVVVEAAMTIYDLSTWKAKLTSAVGKTLISWQEDVTSLVLEDLNELEEENISNIRTIADNMAAVLKFEKKENDDKTVLTDIMSRIAGIEEEYLA